MFYLTTHSTHFIYGYMASDIWLRTILIVRKETRCRHIGYSFRLTARVLLYAPSHRQDNTYHGLCCTSRGALAGTRNSSMGPHHGGSIRRPIAPWANALTTELHLAPGKGREFGGQCYSGTEVLLPLWVYRDVFCLINCRCLPLGQQMSNEALSVKIPTYPKNMGRSLAANWKGSPCSSGDRGVLYPIHTV